ncbi:MAG TPA: alpha/beta hydrolase [Pseudonocardiaceae bacterium]
MTTPTATGLAVIELARAGHFAEIQEMFAPQLRPLVTADVLRAGWEAQGALSAVGTPVSGRSVVRIPVTFEQGDWTLRLGLDDAGLLTGLQLVPSADSWAPPDYVDDTAFDEHDVTIDSGPLPVPGTLSVPHRPGPLPAVVLLGGSGPTDRDETLGRNKPLKDLAWGLASRGIVVLRFDKVTVAHGQQVAGDAAFTLADEYLPDGVAAIHLLQRHPAVDVDRIFVLGHSLGGTVAPRVAAAAEPAVAGLVILAGGTQPMHWAAVRQVSYIASLNPDTADAMQPMIDALTEQAEVADSPDLSPATPKTELPFGVAAAYWLDVRGYHPVDVAAALAKPMLILQGGRDYQVTIPHDLVNWQVGLAHRPDVTIRVFDADNHLFFPGTGPSSPEEYEAAQHMDPEVVADIAKWLMDIRPA